MHELPVTQGILDVALNAAQQNNAVRITAINLVIGELSSIVDDSVQFYFDILSKDTIAQDATLHIQRQPAAVTCLDCRHQFSTGAPLVPLCPECNSARLQVNGGRDFYVESIEIDDENSGS